MRARDSTPTITARIIAVAAALALGIPMMIVPLLLFRWISGIGLEVEKAKGDGLFLVIGVVPLFLTLRVVHYLVMTGLFKYSSRHEFSAWEK